MSDIGFLQQEELFDEAASISGQAPPVVDADALLADPPRVLRLLCAALAIPFSEAMLSWPAGPRDDRRRLGLALVRCGEPLDRLCAGRGRCRKLDDPHLQEAGGSRRCRSTSGSPRTRSLSAPA